jgi:hypothetical protein
VRYLGTNLSLTLGAWRLRCVLALEDAVDGPDGDEGPPVERHSYERMPHHVVRIDPPAASQRRN